MEPVRDHCEMCFDETAVGFCKTCGYIGKACLGIHKKGRAFQSHIINIHEEGEEKTKVIMRDITEECCKEHPKEKAIFLCKAHDCMICGRCLHSGHLSCGKQVVDLLQEAGTIDNDKVNNMKQALNELKNDSLRLKEESRLKNETNEVQAEKCYKELDSLETRLKRSVEDIIRNVRNETCKYQDENIEAFSCIAAVCDENVVWADEEEKQIEELVTNSFTGHLCLRSKAFNKAVSGPKLKMKENEHKQTFKIFCLKENEIALKCLFEDMRDVCHIQEEVDGSDDGSAVTHDVGNATSAIQKTRKELSDELIQVKRDLAKSEKTRKSFEQELLQARQVIEKSEKACDTSADEKCVICMDTIVRPIKLHCGHMFCTECIYVQFHFRKACPICGLILGVIIGNQTPGKMTVYVDKLRCCSGYPDFGTITLNYEFVDGYQTEEHPSPGQFYEEIQETGFIPDNPRGRKICRMLKIAFKRRLVFTIRDEGVITWNDIHHKTDRRPNSQFGYPDPKYLDRVTEDLALNGITENDIQKDDMLQGTLIV
ncbi:uncharacterized protein LOC128241603 [Mya arenaria]|uniref:uncharacterized protein LOC128241603 n=1 Tax=Mya arenaria TaxID=6604 RepID=UPI0022E7A401|nr:uncharacterized protein LOC128241603 [Mya arenaria]XP_052814573.1 uncharacterized protein LOC128241603 [Mya arenaria]